MTAQRLADAPPQRVFFALWPDAAAAAALGRVAKSASRVCGGRPTRPDTIHLTLAFIGNASPGQVAQLQAIGARVAAPAFELELDQVGWWRHNRILWAGAHSVDAALALLVEELFELLKEGGFSLESRPFAAHVTLLRKADCRAGAEQGIEFAPLRWRVPEFVLVESVLRPEGAGYRPLARFALQRKMQDSR